LQWAGLRDFFVLPRNLPPGETVADAAKPL